MNKLVSVVVPVYNHAHTLEKCLVSILNQKNVLIQLIIVNDGSTDGFQNVLDHLLNKYSRLKDLKPLVINQINLGAPAARNRGFNEVLGEYVIFVDADTICSADMFTKMVEALELNVACSFAYSKFKFGFKKMKSNEFDATLLKKINYIDVSSLIRTKDFIFFDEKIKRFQDWDLWLSMIEREKKGVFVPEVLYKKIVRGRRGISNWLPSCFYRLPWKTRTTRDYEEAKKIIFKKHSLN